MGDVKIYINDERTTSAKIEFEWAFLLYMWLFPGQFGFIHNVMMYM